MEEAKKEEEQKERPEPHFLRVIVCLVEVDLFKIAGEVEEELKDIVSSSVKNALEKTIASSLVELAISELKNKVNKMDQDWV